MSLIDDLWEDYQAKEYTDLEKAKIADHLVRDAKDGIKAREDSPYIPPPDSPEARMAERMYGETASKRVDKPTTNTEPQEVSTKTTLDGLRESRAKAEAATKAQERAYATGKRFKQDAPPVPIKTTWQDLRATQKREVQKVYTAAEQADIIRRTNSTEAAKMAQRRATQAPIESSELSRAEDAKHRELQRNYNFKKAEYNRQLELAQQATAQIKAQNAANPTAPKKRFSLGDVSPGTQRAIDRINPPGKVWFSKGTHDPRTGKPWAKPKPPTSPGGSGIDEMVQKVQRNIMQRFNAAKTGTTSQQAGGPTSKALSPTLAAVLNKPGAEIPHLAVGAAIAGVTLSSQAIGILSSGAVKYSAAGAAIDFGIQLASGVDPLRAGFSAFGTGIGSLIGQVGGTLLGGPFGGFLGGTAGAFVGRMASDSLYNAVFGSKQQAVKSKPKTEPPPFTGGQSIGRIYTVDAKRTYGDNIFLDVVRVSFPGIAYGPIRGIRTNNEQQNFLIHSDSVGNLQETIFGTGSSFVYKIVSAIPEDGQPDTGGNIGTVSPNAQALKPSTLQSSPYLPPASYLPGNQSGAVPTLKTVTPPPADLPNESHKRTPHKIALPAGKPLTLTTPDGNSVTVAPSTVPRVISIPRPLPRQTSTNPEKAIQETDAAIAPLPITITSPNAAPIILTSPGTGPVTVSMPGQEPYTFNPASNKNAPLPLSTIRPIGGIQPAELPSTTLPISPIRPIGTPATLDPTAAPTTTSSSTAPATQADLNDLLIPLGALGVLLTQVAQRTTPQAIGDAVEPRIAPAVCSTTQPGGCSSNAMNNAANQGGQNMLNVLGAGAQGAEVGLLNVMNNKLGPQMPGGISSGMGRLSKFLGIDRIFNILNFLVLLHNASMLTSSLKVTLLEMLSSIGNATGLLETPEGENVDLNSVLNGGIEKGIVALVGAEAWASMKLAWRKYNPIYRAAANSLSSIGNMFSSIGNGIEVIGERTGKLGNALMSARVVPENAYNHMSERMNVHTNKFMTFQTKTGSVTDFVEVINEVAETVIEGQESHNESKKSTDAFKLELAKLDKKKVPSADVENEAIKKEAEVIKKNLAKDPTGEDEKGLLSFLTDK